jgi:hypothetical protein
VKILNDHVLRDNLFDLVQNNPLIEKASLDKQQQEKTQSLGMAFRKNLEEDFKATNDRKLALLTAKQRETLRDTALGPLGVYCQGWEMIRFKGQAQPVAIPMPAPYPDFGDKQVQKQLGLSQQQQKQAGDILGGSPTLTDRLMQEWQTLHPSKAGKNNHASGTWTLSGDVNFTGYVTTNYGLAVHESDWKAESKQLTPEEIDKRKAEAEKQRVKVMDEMKQQREKAHADSQKDPLVKLGVDLRKRFEATLTPAQQETYRAMAFQSIGHVAVSDPLMQYIIGLDAQQRAVLQKMERESMAKYQQWRRETNRRLFDALTPSQRETLLQLYWQSSENPPEINSVTF